MTDDLDRIMAVMTAAFDPYWGEAWTRRQVADSLLMPHTHYYLADWTGAVPVDEAPAAGFALVRAAPGEEELLLIGVAPEVRGRGVGSALLRQLAAAAELRGADRIFLEMRANNPAENLYRRHGYWPIGRRHDYYRLADGTRLDAITFACSIGPADFADDE